MHFQLEIRIHVSRFSSETMEVTPKGMEAHGAELYLTWCFSLRSRDIFLNHVIKIELPPVQIPNGVFTTLVTLIVLRSLAGKCEFYKIERKSSQAIGSTQKSWPESQVMVIFQLATPFGY